MTVNGYRHPVLPNSRTNRTLRVVARHQAPQRPSHQGARDARERARTNVPAILRTLMRVRAVSQEQLAAALDMTQPQVSRRLSGVASISQEELAAIAAFFGVTVETFYKSDVDAISDLVDVLRQGNPCFPGFAGSDFAAALAGLDAGSHDPGVDSAA